jgi:cyclopropane-fatty-acyl-phospholipid synthase
MSIATTLNERGYIQEDKVRRNKAAPTRHVLPEIAEKILERIKVGRLEVDFANKGTYRFGDSSSPLTARWTIHRPELFKRLSQEGSLALGESYMDGWWDVADDKLTNFHGILLSNELWKVVGGGLFSRTLNQLRDLRNSSRFLSARKRNIHHHYDLGNDFFRNMLDESMTYSCGYQLNDSDTLADLQRQKYALIAKKLRLDRGRSIVDIGCGWGGMINFATTQFPNITAVGVTLSAEQGQFAREEIESQGNSARASVLLQDYREVEGEYDYFVSIGMFEHVGRSSYPAFMRKIQELLKPGGTGLLHTIASSSDPMYKPDPWLVKYIFPGGYLPRLEEIALEMRKVGLIINHVENLRPHYAVTIRKWKENFDKNKALIRTLGGKFDERFMRMWNYYLQGVEACFRYDSCHLYQVLFEKA